MATTYKAGGSGKQAWAACLFSFPRLSLLRTDFQSLARIASLVAYISGQRGGHHFPHNPIVSKPTTLAGSIRFLANQVTHQHALRTRYDQTSGSPWAEHNAHVRALLLDAATRRIKGDPPQRNIFEPGLVAPAL